jgi:hypothetical protein
VQHRIECLLAGPFRKFREELDVPADERLHTGADGAEHRS